MSFFKSTLLAASAALISTAAFAADPVAETTPGGFDWDGFYAGVGVSVDTASSGAATESYAYIDAIIGFNATNDDILFGVEAWVGAYNEISPATSNGVGGGAEARVGYLASPEALIYAGLGGYVYDGGGQYATLGLGTEFVVAENVTLDIEYKYWHGLNTTWTGHSIGASANWHFE